MEIRVLDRCDNCGLVGRAKFDRRPNAFDYHTRSSKGSGTKLASSHDGESVDKLITNREDDYVLTYSHKKNGKVKKCTIGKLDKNNLNIIKDGKVHEGMKKHIFPFFIQSMKNF